MSELVLLALVAFIAGVLFSLLLRNFLSKEERSHATGHSLLNDKKFHEAANFIDLPVIQTDVTDHIVYVNDSFCSFFGYPREELIGNTVDATIAPDVRREVTDNFIHDHAQLSTAELFSRKPTITAGNRRKDGAIRTVLWTNTRILDEENRLASILSVGQDITQSRNVAEELSRRDKLLNGLLEATHWLLGHSDHRQALNSALTSYAKAAGADRIYIWEKTTAPDAPAKFDKVSMWESPDIPHKQFLPAMPNQFENDPFEWEGRLSAGLVISGKVDNMPEEWQPGLHSNNTRALTVTPIALEERFWGFFGMENCTSDREWSYAERSFISIAGNVIAALTLSRRQLEATASELVQKREVDENLDVTFWELDHDFRVVRVSERAEKVFGVRTDEIVGKKFEKIMASASTHAILDNFNVAAYHAKPLMPILVQAASTKGKRLDLLVVGKPLFSEKHKLTGMRLLTFNITGLIKHGLGANAAGAPFAPETDAARDLVDAANIAKNRFIMIMSHELRSPMNGIIGMLDLLTDTGLTAEQSEYAASAQWSAKHLLSTINRILDYTRLESGGESVEKKTFSLWDVTDEVFKVVGPNAAAKELCLAFIPDDDCPETLAGDAGKLRQTLLHLMSNAVKFTDEGEVTLRARIEKREDPRFLLRFSVIDTGRGLPAQQVQRVFEPFFQMDDSSSREHAGLGLGLSIAKEMVKLMGGEIGAKSTEGEGSCFWFTASFEIPAPSSVGQFVQKRKEAGDASHDPVRVSRISACKLLFVDPCEPERRAFSRMVKGWKSPVEETASADKALSLMHVAAALGDPYNVVIVDTRLADIDAVSFAKSIKSDPALAESALVALVPMETVVTPEYLDSTIFSSIIEKPILRQELFRTLFRLSENKGHQTIMMRLDDAITRRLPAEKNDTEPLWRRNVLLVEDSRINQMVAVSSLEKIGCRVDVAENGQKAIELLAKNQYDLVLMDCQMPVMDGYQATEHVRNGDFDVLNPKIPIVAMTANNDRDDRERCLAIGMNGYISKPFSLDVLQAVVDGDFTRVSGHYRAGGGTDFVVPSRRRPRS